MLYRQLKDRGLAVIAYQKGSRRGAASRLELYREQFGLTFSLISEGSYPYGYAAFGTPNVVILDRAGKIVAFRRGTCDWNGSEVRALIEALLIK